MTVRTTMSTLITRLRVLLNDPSGTSAVWTDQQLQDWLDVESQPVVQLPLDYAQQVVGGQTVTLRYWAPVGDWETGAELTDAQGSVVTATVADLLTGRWSFATDQPPPLYLTGTCYDLYAAAAVALETRANQLALEFDFSADGASYQRSQQRVALLQLAEQYRGHARPSIVQNVRSDILWPNW